MRRHPGHSWLPLPRLVAAALLAPLALLADAGSAGAAAPTSGAELRVGGDVYRLTRAVARDGRRFFSATEALRVLKLRHAWEPATSRLAFGSGKRAGIVWAGIPSVTVSRQRVPLSAAPFVHKDELMVPVDFAERALTAVLGRRVTVAFAGPVPLAPPERAFSLVVLDPGHGGRDTGAVGPRGTQEKDLTLAIAKRTRDILVRESDLEVLLTRETDVFVPLQARVAMANARGADLFVSIHLNAAPSRDAIGTETYFLSAVASDDAARASAEFENRSLELEETRPGAPTADLAFILGDLARTASIRESEAFAASLQDRFVREAPSVRGVNRGVKQAPFYVLVGAQMPAVLTEVGFISNPQQEAALRSPRVQEEIARAIARSILAYRDQVNSTMGLPVGDDVVGPRSAPAAPVRGAAGTATTRPRARRAAN
ncbi:MAG TPA: N-acetylmuramoyl-L-alanine amidase [Thermodesulfobacteriota bacterium]